MKEKSLKEVRKEIRNLTDWRIKNYGCYVSYKKGIGYYSTERCTDKYTKYIVGVDGRTEEYHGQEVIGWG